MAALTWDEQGEKLYETGIKKCVLYPLNSNNEYTPGVAWNGISSVSESPSGAEATAIYADDIKYLNMYSAEELGATIEAYMYPDEWESCDGSADLTSGITIGQQNRKTFGLCYRTTLGNDTDGNDYGYKLHLLYGCKASPSERQYGTINDSPEAISFSWTITTTPVNVTGYKPTSIITIDSTKFKTTERAAKLTALEQILYGSSNSEPRLPLPDEIKTLMGETVTLTFNANGHGTAPAAQTVTKGGTATEPTDPEAEGYTFGGWFNEAGCTTEFSFSTALNDNKTVYAKWTESEG